MWLFSIFVNGIIVLRGEKMAIYDFEKLQNMVSIINKEELYTTICRNTRKMKTKVFIRKPKGFLFNTLEL